MILTEKKYAENEYDDLVRELLQSPDIDAELQYYPQSILNSNPNFYLLMFRAIEKIRDAATQSNDVSLLAALNPFEAKLYEYTNVIPADLPDSILRDRNLVGYYLTDHHKAVIEKDWQEFQTHIKRKSNEIPKEIELPFLEWCDKILKMNLERHNKKCKDPGNCGINQGYDRRLLFISKLVEEAAPEQTELLPVSLNLPTQDSGLRLVDQKGAKIDFIRVINAMWELGFFRGPDGLILPKLTVMKAFGNFLEIDLSDYYKDLNQAFDTSKPEPNIRIFKQLEEVTKNKVLGVKT